MSLWIKICGVTSVQDALLVEQAGADAVGLNFAPQSPRVITPAVAREIARALKDKVELVGVFVDATEEQIREIAAYASLDTAQLHGSETPEFLQHVSQSVPAYKALRVGSAADVDAAASYCGDRILADAKVEGALGGTGQTFDWTLIEGLNAERKLILAGGLRPENIEACVRELLPYGVDTASGVETQPGKKSPEMVGAFVRAARRGERA